MDNIRYCIPPNYEDFSFSIPSNMVILRNLDGGISIIKRIYKK